MTRRRARNASNPTLAATPAAIASFAPARRSPTCPLIARRRQALAAPGPATPAERLARPAADRRTPATAASRSAAVACRIAASTPTAHSAAAFSARRVNHGRRFAWAGYAAARARCRLLVEPRGGGNDLVGRFRPRARRPEARASAGTDHRLGRARRRRRVPTRPLVPRLGGALRPSRRRGEGALTKPAIVPERQRPRKSAAAHRAVRLHRDGGLRDAAADQAGAERAGAARAQSPSHVRRASA